MPQIPIPCPFKMCESIQSFESESSLIHHVEAMHKVYLGVDMKQLVQKGLLFPLWFPSAELQSSYATTTSPLPSLSTVSYRPWHLVDVSPHPGFRLPDVHAQSANGMAAIPSVMPPPPYTIRLRNSGHSPVCQSQFQSHYSMQSRGMGPGKKKMEDFDFDFEDLPGINLQSFSSKLVSTPLLGLRNYSRELNPCYHPRPDELVIQRRPVIRDRDVSRPFHLPKRDEYYGRSPPSSMGYQVFGERVDQLRKNGIL
ncbi:hypothetical protein GYMLUDRAFT_746952 [Collybiopsis luxurians FD-317 M1]|uniref:Uncharacterized protein n=1 Tax=Collybiopsis luxurians FD-317 M1 TaxID=944289 RepID=A0A0D0CQM9_9AGAR|nr:hypothetical protein GYMLUDRAFT_746952 [Collybiopsis luxurians FD-317 M1]